MLSSPGRRSFPCTGRRLSFREDHIPYHLHIYAKELLESIIDIHTFWLLSVEKVKSIQSCLLLIKGDIAMKPFGIRLIVFTYALMTLVAKVAYAQEDPAAKLQAELVGTWLAEVEGEGRDRGLIIKSIQKISDDSFALEAKFGLLEKPNPTSASEMQRTDNGYRLNLTAKSGARIVATLLPDGAFKGTFFGIDGINRPITFTKITKQERKARTAITKLPNDVPEACAVFIGNWVGTWTQGNIGKALLRVTDIDSACTAKILYGSNPAENVEIKNGELTWVCNKTTNGTCILTFHGNELLATYSNPQGGRNSAVFRHTQ